jgi:hypothetical protein
MQFSWGLLRVLDDGDLIFLRQIFGDKIGLSVWKVLYQHVLVDCE